MDEPPEKFYDYFGPEGFAEEISNEKDIYKKYSINDFPELVPYYNKLFNLPLERQTLLNPYVYKKLKEKIKKEGLTQDNKILLARIYGQLKKFENEIYSLDFNALSLMITKYSIQLKIINRTLYDVAKIKKILTQYEYKLSDFPPNIGLDEFYKKLESFREAKFPTEAIAELFRMREQAAARVLFATDLRTRYQILRYDIHKYMEEIRKFFENPQELNYLYTQYIFPYFDLPEI
jgi:hypothetical protein